MLQHDELVERRIAGRLAVGRVGPVEAGMTAGGLGGRDLFDLDRMLDLLPAHFLIAVGWRA